LKSGAGRIAPTRRGVLFITQEDLAMSAARLFLPVALVAALSSGQLRGAEPANRVVHVSGAGLVRVVPDEVVIDMTITTVDDDLMRVRTDSDDQARAVSTLAKKHGVQEDQFQVSRLELSLDYSEQLRRQVYQVERDITITLHRSSSLDGLLSELLAVPSSKVTGITFGTTKARENGLEALRRAVADAREKATLLANLNGLTLGKARDIRIVTEVSSPFVISVVPVVGSSDDRMRDGVAEDRGKPEPRTAEGNSKAPAPVRLVAFEAAGGQPQREAKSTEKATPFALGLIDHTASVSIDFELAE
jgi:uncharacterized protein YggE